MCCDISQKYNKPLTNQTIIDKNLNLNFEIPNKTNFGIVSASKMLVNLFLLPTSE